MSACIFAYIARACIFMRVYVRARVRACVRTCVLHQEEEKGMVRGVCVSAVDAGFPSYAQQ